MPKCKNLQGQVIWQSVSAKAYKLELHAPLVPEAEYFGVQLINGKEFFVLREGVNTSELFNKLDVMTVTIYLDKTAFNTKVAQFKISLRIWLVVMLGVFLLAHFILLEWGIAPLRRMKHDVQAIESGDEHKLSEDYATEINDLAKNLNQILQHSRSHRDSFRDNVANLKS